MFNNHVQLVPIILPGAGRVFRKKRREQGWEGGGRKEGRKERREEGRGGRKKRRDKLGMIPSKQ